MSDPQTPRTAAGRRLFTDNEPMDMYESDGVTWEDVVAIEAEAAEQSVPPRRLVPDDQLGYLHDGQWFPAEQRTAPRTAAQEALDEFDNIRWDDIWQRVNASGEDDLARWSKKYAGYVRSALVRAVEQSVPPLDGLRAELELMESVGWPGTSHEYRRGVQYAISRLSSLVPQPSERREPARPADDLEAVHKLATILHQRESAGQQRCGPNSRGCRMRHRMDAASILMEVGPAQPADTALREAIDHYYDTDHPGVDEDQWRVGLVNAIHAALAAQPTPAEEER